MPSVIILLVLGALKGLMVPFFPIGGGPIWWHVKNHQKLRAMLLFLMSGVDKCYHLYTMLSLRFHFFFSLLSHCSAQFNVWKCRRSCFISLPSWKMKHPLPLANVLRDTYRVYEESQGRIVMKDTELSQTHIESSCWGEEPEKRRTKKQMEQREYHSQLHGLTWWSPSLKGQLHCNSAGPTRRSLTLLSGMVQKWSQFSGENQSWLHRSERSTHKWGFVCKSCFLRSTKCILAGDLGRSDSPSDECVLPFGCRWLPRAQQHGCSLALPDQNTSVSICVSVIVSVLIGFNRIFKAL